MSMNPEEVCFHYLVLLSGIRDTYDAALDRVLEQEDPLSDLTLALSGCMSDVNQPLFVLKEYLLDHPVREEYVYPWIIKELGDRQRAGTMTYEQAGAAFSAMAREGDFREPEIWADLTFPEEVQELYEDHLISRYVYEAVMDHFLLCGERWDPWKLQNEKRKRLETPEHSRSYRLSLAGCITCVALSFGVIFAGAAMTGWREMRDFSRQDWFAWWAFAAMELVVIWLEFRLALRASRLWHQGSAKQRKILAKYKTAGLQVFSQYDRVYWEKDGIRRAVAFRKEGMYAVTIQCFDFENRCWQFAEHEEELEDLAAVEEFLQENQDFIPEER